MREQPKEQQPSGDPGPEQSLEAIEMTGILRPIAQALIEDSFNQVRFGATFDKNSTLQLFELIMTSLENAKDPETAQNEPADLKKALVVLLRLGSEDSESKARIIQEARNLYGRIKQEGHFTESEQEEMFQLLESLT